MPTMIGEKIGGYILTEKIGEGAMAEVYKAYDVAHERDVAIKILPRRFYQDEQFRTRFYREAEVAARLDHPHILPVLDHGEQDEQIFLVMPYVSGGTLENLLRKRADRILPVEVTLRLLREIGLALDYAHSRGFLHRDLKPSNIMLGASSGATYLMDFGVVKIAGAKNITGQNILGTPQYMSPEQCLGRGDLSPATDQYALGIIAYRMLTGELPFNDSRPLFVLQMQIRDPLPLPSEANPAYSSQVDDVLFTATAKQPEYRYPNLLSFVNALSEAL